MYLLHLPTTGNADLRNYKGVNETVRMGISLRWRCVLPPIAWMQCHIHINSDHVYSITSAWAGITQAPKKLTDIQGAMLTAPSREGLDRKIPQGSSERGRRKWQLPAADHRQILLVHTYCRTWSSNQQAQRRLYKGVCIAPSPHGVLGEGALHTALQGFFPCLVNCWFDDHGHTTSPIS